MFILNTQTHPLFCALPNGCAWTPRLHSGRLRGMRRHSLPARECPECRVRSSDQSTEYGEYRVRSTECEGCRGGVKSAKGWGVEGVRGGRRDCNARAIGGGYKPRGSSCVRACSNYLQEIVRLGQASIPGKLHYDSWGAEISQQGVRYLRSLRYLRGGVRYLRGVRYLIGGVRYLRWLRYLRPCDISGG